MHTLKILKVRRKVGRKKIEGVRVKENICVTLHILHIMQTFNGH